MVPAQIEEDLRALAGDAKRRAKRNRNHDSAVSRHRRAELLPVMWCHLDYPCHY